MVFQVQVDVLIGLFFFNFKYIVLFIMNRIASFELNIIRLMELNGIMAVIKMNSVCF